MIAINNVLYMPGHTSLPVRPPPDKLEGGDFTEFPGMATEKYGGCVRLVGPWVPDKGTAHMACTWRCENCSLAFAALGEQRAVIYHQCCRADGACCV